MVKKLSVLEQHIRLVMKLEEGIDYDVFNRTVSYNPSHEEGADTSDKNDPTYTDEFGKDVRVYSVFKRKHDNYRDAKPLIYALKGENDWHFKTNRDKNAIYSQAEKILKKLSAMYPAGVTIMCPSGGTINKAFASLIQSTNKKATIITDLLIKLTAEQVIDACIAPNSYFRKIYNTKAKFNAAYEVLNKAKEEMGRERNGYLTFHFIHDNDLRNAITRTVELNEDTKAKYVAQINDKDVLIIDDAISHSNTIKDVINEIKGGMFQNQ